MKKESEKDAGSEAAETKRVKDGVGQEVSGEEEEEEAAQMSATRVRRIPEAETDFTASFLSPHLTQICDAKVHVVSITARFSSPFSWFLNCVISLALLPNSSRHQRACEQNASLLTTFLSSLNQTGAEF